MRRYKWAVWIVEGAIVVVIGGFLLSWINGDDAFLSEIDDRVADAVGRLTGDHGACEEYSERDGYLPREIEFGHRLDKSFGFEGSRNEWCEIQ